MKKLGGISIVFALFFLAACGEGGGGGNSAPANPNAPVLNPIGNKTITLGDPALSFTVGASDPNNLTVILSSDGSVGSGANPYSGTGNLATFNPNTGQFSWNVGTVVAPGDYYVEFTATNSNGYSDSETIRIRVQQYAQFNNGETKYNADCRSCHGPGGAQGSQTLIQCIDSITYYEKINTGSMRSYASGWSNTDKADVLYYLNNVNPGAC